MTFHDDVLYFAIENVEEVKRVQPGLRMKLVSLLLKSGADLNRHSSNDIPLQCAVNHDDVSTTQILLANGAAINTRDDDGKNALHIICDARYHDNSGKDNKIIV